MLEFVQKQFPLLALRGLNWDTGGRLPSYHARLRLLDLPTLNPRRKCHGVMFLHKQINGDVDTPFLMVAIRLLCIYLYVYTTKLNIINAKCIREMCAYYISLFLKNTSSIETRVLGLLAC